MRGLPNTPSELVIRVRNGDNEAVAEIYNLIWKPATISVYYGMGARSQYKEEAEDIASKKLFQCIEKIQDGTFKGEDNFSGYYYKALEHHLNDYFRKDKHVRPMETFTEYNNEDFKDYFEDSLENGSGFFSSSMKEFEPEENTDYTVIKEGVQNCLAKLPEEQRAALYMFYFEKKTIQEICSEFDAKENTVKGWLYYGRNNIKDQIEKLRKANKSFYGILPIPFLVWVFEETSSMFVPKDASWITSQIVVGSKEAAKSGAKKVINNDVKNHTNNDVKTHSNHQEVHSADPVKSAQVQSEVSHSTSAVGSTAKVAGTAAKTGFLSSTIGKVALAGVICAGAIGGGYAVMSNNNGNSTETSSEENDSATTTDTSKSEENYPYKAGVYDMSSAAHSYALVYAEPSMDSEYRGMMVRTESRHMFVTKEIVKGTDGESYWAKLKYGYVCLTDENDVYTFVKEIPVLASDYSEDLYRGYLMYHEGSDTEEQVKAYAKACGADVNNYYAQGLGGVFFDGEDEYLHWTTDCTSLNDGGNDNLMYY